MIICMHVASMVILLFFPAPRASTLPSARIFRVSVGHPWSASTWVSNGGDDCVAEADDWPHPSVCASPAKGVDECAGWVAPVRSALLATELSTSSFERRICGRSRTMSSKGVEL